MTQAINNSQVHQVFVPDAIDGVVPGVRGQRAFPTRRLNVQDPFVMLDHIGPQNMPADFRVNGAKHPHRGFETITFLFEGRMQHTDTLGNDFWFESGDVQNMNAGKGIQHGGDMAADEQTHRFHEVQLWVNSPAKDKMSEPSIHTVRANEIPTVSIDHGYARIIAGKLLDQQGPVSTFANIAAAHLVADKAMEFEVTVPEGHDRALVYSLEGAPAIINGQMVQAFETRKLEEDETRIQISATDKGQWLVLTGESIKEPVALGGSFVMNTQEEIQTAFADFRAGKF